MQSLSPPHGEERRRRVSNHEGAEALPHGPPSSFETHSHVVRVLLRMRPEFVWSA